GGAGTILNNLVALGVGEIRTVGFCGDDGEGYELRQALRRLPGVDSSRLLSTPERRTFTYCKPLLLHATRPPEELHRLDSKNWSPTPPAVEAALLDALEDASGEADAVIILDQVDLPDTGVVTATIREALGRLAIRRPDLLLLADSRRGLAGWPALGFKMNAAELGSLLGRPAPADPPGVARLAAELARRQARPVFVTLSERGIVGAGPDGTTAHVPAMPVRGPIDIVGAGDAVTANLATALAAGAGLTEAMELAMAAAHLVVHQLGTTGTASVAQIRACLGLG
ncbi:MAG: PfkB family carbohydrate kinase, partial [Verrucomicrobiota bacterium]